MKTNCEKSKSVLFILDYLGRIDDLKVVLPKVIPKRITNLKNRAHNNCQFSDLIIESLSSEIIRRFIEHSKNAIIESTINSIAQQTEIACTLCSDFENQINQQTDFIFITVVLISRQLNCLIEVLAEISSEEFSQLLCTSNLSLIDCELLISLLLNDIYNVCRIAQT